MSADDGTAPARERGWLRPIAALLVMVLVTTQSVPRIVAPVGDVLLLLAPVTAACAVAGWRAGGRLPLAVLWTVFAAWVVWRSPGPGPHLDLMATWAILLALSFGVVAGRAPEGAFLPKALLAVVATSAVATALLLAAPGGIEGAQAVVDVEIGQRSMAASREWEEMSRKPEWIELTERSPGWRAYGELVQRELEVVPAVGRQLFPALLALQSLAALALGWGVYHRVGRARLGPPLARLREMRFHEALAWGVIVGLVLVAFPSGEGARLVGLNLLLFFGVLYVIRGLGVLLWFLPTGKWMMALWLVLAVFFWPIIAAVSAGLGLGDTWFDWRRLVRSQSQRSE